MKRIAVKLVVFLLLGAVVNVGVAWGCAVSTTVSLPLTASDRITGLYEARSPASPWRCQIAPRRGTTLVVWEPLRKQPAQVLFLMGGNLDPKEHWKLAHKRLMATHPWTYVGRLTTYNNLAPLPDHPVLMWADPPLRSIVTLNDIEVDSIHGFPFQYLQFSSRHTLPASVLRVPGRTRISLGRGVPGGLLVGPAAVNSVVFAFTIWLLLFGYGDIRSVVRHKRGRCIKCGYDLRGAEHEVCPECGRGGSAMMARSRVVTVASKGTMP